MSTSTTDTETTLSPIRIEAENYDTSNTDVTVYTTTDESGQVIRSRSGTILTYTVDVPASGTYDFTARVVAPKSRSYSFDAELDGQTFTFSFGTTSGGWENYTDVTLSGIALSAGRHTLTLMMTSSMFNLNYLELTPTGTTTPPEPLPGIIAFDAPSYTVSEDGTEATITLERTGGSDGEVSVDLGSTNGTATDIADYANVSQTVTFAPGEVLKTITIPVVDDTLVEGDETVNLSLSNATGGATLGVTSAATLTITDNDLAGTLAFNADSYTVAEDGPEATITLERTGGTAGTVTVDLVVVDGTANAPGDYVNVSQTITFLEGETSKTVNLPVVDDAEVEGSETVGLSLTNATGGATLGATNAATLTITDNDTNPDETGSPIRIEAENYDTSNTDVTVYTTTDESGQVIRSRSGTILTYTVDVPAAGTYDFTARVVAPKSGTYSFEAELGGQTVPFTFESTPGGWDRFVDVTLPGITLAAGSYPLTLTMNSSRFNLNYLELTPSGTTTPPELLPGIIAFDAPSYIVSEDGIEATITLERTGGSDGEVSVDLGSTDGTANAPGDYTNVSQTVTFAPGEVLKTITIPVVDDTLVEGDETVNLSLSNATGGATLGVTSAATLTITDNDLAGTLAFNADSYTVAEDGPEATITLERTGGTAGTVTVDLVVADGTANAPGDYVNVSQTITFLEGETSKTVNLPVVDDAEVEGSETVGLSLTNATGGATLGATNAATLTITDNDTNPDETGSPIRIEAENYDTSNTDVTVYTTTDESGQVIRSRSGTILTYTVDVPAAGTYDFTARVVAPKSGTYSFEAELGGQTVPFTFESTPGGWDRFVDVTLPGITLAAGSYPLTLTMNSSRFNLNYLELTPSGTTTPPEPLPGIIAFDAPSYTVSEDGTEATITLERTGGSDGEVSVDLGSTDGTANAPGDYTNVSQTVTFAPGEVLKTITMPVVDDTLVEGDETINLSLSNATGGATLGATSAATLTITDNDGTTPPSLGPIRIMPLGDSITDGYDTFPGGYRDRLENLLEANNIAFDFVGSQNNGPSSLSDREHEGHSGWRIDEIASNVDSWLATNTPDVVLLTIGTNDILREYLLDAAPDRHNSLVGQILTTTPDAHVVVGTVPPLKNRFDYRLAGEYNSAISANMTTRINAGQSVSLVDQYNALESADLGDGIHPNQGGYNKMAGVWFDGLLDVLGNFGDYTAISDEFFVNAELTASDGFSSTISAELVNNSSSSRSDLAFRHFVDLTELFNAGYGTEDVLIGTLNGPMVGDLTLWDAAEDIYYVEASFEGMEIAAGESAMVEFSLGVDSATVPDSAWDAGNDWSTQHLTNTASKTRYMPVYDSSGDILSGVVFA